MSPVDYGTHRYSIGSAYGLVSAYADAVSILPNGALLLVRRGKDGSQVTFAFGPGRWRYIYLSDEADGPVAVVRWDD